jgi:hypothetical protein
MMSNLLNKNRTTFSNICRFHSPARYRASQFDGGTAYSNIQESTILPFADQRCLHEMMKIKFCKSDRITRREIMRTARFNSNHKRVASRHVGEVVGCCNSLFLFIWKAHDAQHALSITTCYNHMLCASSCGFSLGWAVWDIGRRFYISHEVYIPESPKFGDRIICTRMTCWPTNRNSVN